MADETTRLVMEIVGRDRGGKKTLTDTGKAADKAADSTKDLDKASDKAGKSLGDMAKDADKLQGEIDKTEKSIQDLAKQIKENPGDSGLFKQLNAEQAKMRRLLRVQDLLNPKEAEKAGEQAGVSLFAGFRKKFGPAQIGVFAKKGLSAGAAAAGGAALAAGAALGGVLMDGVRSAFEKSRADALLKAQLGKAVPAVGDVGKLSGKVYADNFGDSVEDVNQAIKNVIRQGLVDAKNTSKQELVDITEQVLTVAKVTEETTDRIAGSATQLVRTGLVKNINEALDLITAASQQGLDKAGDLLDTLNEYGTQFRKLGLTGPEALGLIGQAMRAGARDSDLAADALKEFSIRAIDGSVTTRDAFRSIGLDADKMRDAFAQGGDTAKKALDLVLDRLRGVRDPAERARIQVELFGTQAEDLGDALNALDLDSASKEMDGFAGATERANKQMSSGAGGQYAALLRRLKGETVSYVSSLTDANAKQAEFAVNVTKAYLAGSGQTGQAAGKLAADLSKKYDLAAIAASGTKTSADKLNVALKTQATDLRSAATAAGGLANALDAITGANVDAKRAESDFEAAVDDAAAAVGKHVDKIDLATQRGRDYNTQLLNIRDAAVRYAEATFNQTGSQDKANKIIAAGRDQLYKTARQMGLSKDAAHRYVDQILRIPKSWTTKVTANTKGALGDIDTIRKKIQGLPSKKTIQVALRLTGNTNVSAQIAALGKNRRDGGIEAAASGRLSAGIVTDQTILFGERATGGEAFIPRIPGKGGRARQRQIVETAAGWAGGTVMWDGASAVPRFKASTSGGAVAPVVLHISATGSATDFDRVVVAAFQRGLAQNRIQAKVANGRLVPGV